MGYYLSFTLSKKINNVNIHKIAEKKLDDICIMRETQRVYRLRRKDS
jgi:hypothetical protein